MDGQKNSFDVLVYKICDKDFKVYNYIVLHVLQKDHRQHCPCSSDVTSFMSFCSVLSRDLDIGLMTLRRVVKHFPDSDNLCVTY